MRDASAEFAERPCYWVKADGREFSAVSYFDWRTDMKRFSAYLLHSLEIQHGERVGLICDNRYEWNLLSLGITTIGATDVPRGCDATIADIVYILNHAKCATVIVENEKMLRALCDSLDELPNIKHVMAVESPDRFKDLENLKSRLGRIRLHFLMDALAIGEEFLELQGELLLKKRGEAIRPSDPASIIYTSGTTGRPKGVILNHRSFCWEAAQIQSLYPISEQDRTVIFLPPWHIAERLLETVLIAAGASMACSGLLTLGPDLQAVKPTMLVSVPRVWEQLYKRVFDNVRKQPDSKQNLFHFCRKAALTHTDIVDTLLDRFAQKKEESSAERYSRKVIATALYPFYAIVNVFAQLILARVRNILGGKLRFAISGAGALPEHVAVFFRSIGIPILDAYGLTETTGVSAAGELPWPQRDAVGKPLAGVQLEIRDENGRPITRPGAPGILWHKGPHVMSGYLDEPEETAKVLQDGWFNSGDIFAWTVTGEVAFVGRAKDTIVLSGGENVEPGPIEQRLNTSDFILQAVVVGQDRKQLSVLILPNFDLCRGEFASRGSEAPEDPTAWNDAPAVRSFFQELIKGLINQEAGFKPFERLSGFYLLSREFEKGRELTESMKVKRNVVLALYEKEINGIYC